MGGPPQPAPEYLGTSIGRAKPPWALGRTQLGSSREVEVQRKHSPLTLVKDDEAGSDRSAWEKPKSACRLTGRFPFDALDLHDLRLTDEVGSDWFALEKFKSACRLTGLFPLEALDLHDLRLTCT